MVESIETDIIAIRKLPVDTNGRKHVDLPSTGGPLASGALPEDSLLHQVDPHKLGDKRHHGRIDTSSTVSIARVLSRIHRHH